MLKKPTFALAFGVAFATLFVSRTEALTLISTSTVAAGEVPVNTSTDTAVVLSSGMLPVPSPTASILDERLAYERFNRSNPFVLSQYHTNYLLPFAYNFNPNQRTFNTGGGSNDTIQRTELKFQLSIKVNLVKDLIKDQGDLYVAYTQQSYWQAYNTGDSSPFRETNYAPEAGFTLYDDLHFLGFRSRVVTLALMHQSNGRSSTESRSWNRVFAEFIVQRGNFYVSLKPWYRIKEPASSDDNPDIEKYLGYGDLTFDYDYHKQLLSVMLRNNLRAQNKNSVTAEYSFPMGPKLRGFFQYFYGYGESLIDYNHINNRIALGFSIGSGL